jgi:O-antigen ligase
MDDQSSSTYRNILAVVAIAVFFTNMPSFLYYKYPGLFGTPKMWVLGFAVLTVPLLLNYVWRWNLRDWPLLLWCAFYVWLSLLSYYTTSDSDVAWQEVRLRLQTVLLLVCTMLIFAHPDAVRWAQRTLVLAVMFGLLTTIYEFFFPMSLGSSLARPAGFYLNANQAGFALVLGMALCLPVVSPKFRGMLVLLTGLAVLATMSRSNAIVWFLTVVFGVWTGLLQMRRIAVTAAFGALLITVLFLPRVDDVYEFLRTSDVWGKDIEERLEWFMNPSIQSSPYSNESSSRLDAAEMAWSQFSERPWWGQGVGTALQTAGGAGNEKEVTMGAHNMYLSNMVDHGFLGILIFPLAVAAMIWSARGNAKLVSVPFATILLFSAFFLHTILQDTFPLPLFSLMAAMTVLSRGRDAGRSQAPDTRAPVYRGNEHAAWQI